MEYIHLGRTGVQVSRLCLGTLNFGQATSEADSFTIMDCALDLGINYFDTANSYGWKFGEGFTEQVIGRWMAQGGQRRERIVLATKVFSKMGNGVNDEHLSAYHIHRACEESLRRLQTDHIDLYQMHHIDPDTSWDEIWEAMQRLVEQGKVIYVGSSNFAGWNIAQAQEQARQRHFLGLVSEQSLYNLAVRAIELEVIPACRAYGLGLVPWSPLYGGILGGVLEKPEGARRSDERGLQRLGRHRSQVQQYEAFCKQIGETPADVALAWLLANPAVTAPIIGPRTLEQLQTSMHALEIHLDQETLSRLDQIWPGPGGEAPQAYAW